MNEQKQKPVRWWPVWIILILGFLTFGALWLGTDMMRQFKMMASYALVILVGLVLLLWALLLSRFPWRIRLGVLGLAVVIVGLLVSFVRVRGMTGDWVPVLAWSWTPEQNVGSAAAEGVVVAPADAALAAFSFPQFLGPRRDSRVVGVALPRDFSAAAPELLWRREIGSGWSGFVVADGLAVTLEQRGTEETVTAYELETGRPAWSHADEARFDFNSWLGGVGPRSTPTIADGAVYTYGATGILNRLDLRTGELRWTRQVAEENDARLPEWGNSCSPLIYGELVVVTASGGDGRALVAYNRETGEPVWSGGSDGASYASPFVARLAGVPQIVILNGKSLAGHDPADGRLLWRQAWDSGGNPTAAQPLPIGENRFMVSAGYGIGSKLFEVTATGDGVFSSSPVWESMRMKAKFSQMIEHQGVVYALDDGILAAVDPATGERLWKRGRYGHGQVLLVDDLLLVSTEKGEVVVVEPDPGELRELTRFQALEGKVWNPPALAGTYLLMRNDQEAVCYKLPDRAS